LQALAAGIQAGFRDMETIAAKVESTFLRYLDSLASAG